MNKNNCELFRVMKLVGEKEVQIVERTACPVPEYTPPVRKVLKVLVKLDKTEDLLFTNKVVKEGVFEIQIIFACCDDLVRHISLELPFMMEAEIAGARPGMQVQNTVIRTEQNVTVVTNNPKDELTCQVFDIRVVALILTRVTETVERKLAKCRSRRECFYSSGNSTTRYQQYC